MGVKLIFGVADPGIYDQGKGNEGKDVTQFGRIVDSTFRSVNNLLEKFSLNRFFLLRCCRQNTLCLLGRTCRRRFCWAYRMR